MLDEDEVRALGERGFFVRDRFIAAEVIARARAEIAELPLRPAGTSREAVLDAGERGDRIAWLDVATAPPGLAELCARFDELRGALTREAWLPVVRYDIQAAHYP